MKVEPLRSKVRHRNPLTLMGNFCHGVKARWPKATPLKSPAGVANRKLERTTLQY